ncbi:unnamed protein product [Zymoseptoria tritici ST99CH_1A5]|uniref:Suppressor of forked domain-containing protein n=1 Tax=Zymoseptoria tritici ST99CH_1A5 TaxID=1276529 RepID=A0A1Y6LN27_ZYMTR|nr:unnamed protein product [Zymoseptoria tritici ST99CH_1A5]
MADFSYSDDLELQRLNDQVNAQPEEFENWEKLVRAAESQEGGLNRNSSPQAIAATRDTYDRFLARFPLFFGYWKKYADLEFSIAGPEAAEMVYERGVASIGVSVDIWANYCAFKVETSHDADVTRELFERAADSVGLDFLAHPFWDKYLEFEERLESHDRIFAILGRIIHIPLHQYARYFERYRSMSERRPITDVAPAEVITRINEEMASETEQRPRNPTETERELRARVDAYLLDIFHRTQHETSTRWTFEQEIKRPYYHVTELDDAQLANWRKYLDFEEAEPNNYTRTRFLYERCLVTAANYDEFWFRYARWTRGQAHLNEQVRNEEVRNIYQRASCVFVFTDSPEIRLQYARFEESLGKADVAVAIHEAVLMILPAHLETILSLVNTHRRQYGVDAAIEVLNQHAMSQGYTPYVRGALVAELARLTWKAKGDVPAARKIFEENAQYFPDCRKFWFAYLLFERDLPVQVAEGKSKGKSAEEERYTRLKKVYDAIRSTARLDEDTMRELSGVYLEDLELRGGEKAMQEWVRLDGEIWGPVSVQGERSVGRGTDVSSKAV